MKLNIQALIYSIFTNCGSLLKSLSCHFVLCFLMLTGFCFPSIAQVNNTGQMYISGNVYANTSFTNASTATYQNDGNFYLTGDFMNSQASMTEGTGTTQFIGTSLQNITGTQTSVFHHVYLNNASGVKMNLNTTMGGTISTVAGSLYFNGYALTMGGKINTAYTNSSAFNVTATSDLNITGPAATGNGIYFSASANTLHNLTISSGATGALGNALNIIAGNLFGTVTANGNFDAAGFLTLKSDANGTARVASSAGNITNNVTVERYIPPRRAWRFMSVPVNNDTLHIRTAWQEGVNNPSLTIRYNPNPGYGTQITGDNNTANGYDYNTTYNASIKTWVQSTNSWSTTAPPTVSTLINSYDGYCLFVRGSRAVDLAQATSAIPDPTILRITGTIYNGLWSKPYSGIVSGSILLVGNPYASSVDISSMLTASTGIYNNKFYVWDPALSGGYGVGGYVTYSNGIMTPLTTNYPAATTIIQGNQAFLVQANSTAATIKFKQNDKTASESSVFGKSIGAPIPAIYANLMVPSDSTYTIEDGVATGLGSQFKADTDKNNAIKLWNFYENIAQLKDGKYFSIEFRPIPVLSDTVFYRMYLRQQPYALQLFCQNMSAKVPIKAWLVDRYLNTKTEISLYDTTLYNFTPNPDTNSYRNRFMLVFNRQLIATPVPVTTITNQNNPDVTGIANSINASAGETGIYPNPVTGNSFILHIRNLKEDDYTMAVYSSKGAIIFTQKINYQKGSSAYNISLLPTMAAGTYIIQLLNSNGDQVKSILMVVARK